MLIFFDTYSISCTTAIKWNDCYGSKNDIFPHFKKKIITLKEEETNNNKYGKQNKGVSQPFFTQEKQKVLKGLITLALESSQNFSQQHLIKWEKLLEFF